MICCDTQSWSLCAFESARLQIQLKVNLFTLRVKIVFFCRFYEERLKNICYFVHFEIQPVYLILKLFPGTVRPLERQYVLQYQTPSCSTHKETNMDTYCVNASLMHNNNPDTKADKTLKLQICFLCQLSCMCACHSRCR